MQAYVISYKSNSQAQIVAVSLRGTTSSPIKSSKCDSQNSNVFIGLSSCRIMQVTRNLCRSAVASNFPAWWKQIYKRCGS